MAGSASNVVISPMDAFWQIEARECLDTTGLVDPDGTEFNLYKVDGTKVRMVYDLDASSTIPAAGPGEIVIEIDVVTGDSEASLATKTASAIDGDADLIASADGNIVSVRRAAVGEVTDAADVDSGIGVTTVLKGKNYDLGLLAPEDIAPNVEPAVFDVTAHQTGVTVLSVLGQGFATNEVELTLLETGKSQLDDLYKIWGGQFTPGGGTEVFGMGTSIVGKNMLTEAARLVLQPRNSISDDLSYNYNLPLVVPVPSTLTFSGENPRTLTSTWRGFPDLDIDSRVDSVLIGDAFQSGLFT